LADGHGAEFRRLGSLRGGRRCSYSRGFSLIPGSPVNPHIARCRGAT
jgi:hypothetical protein